jgi:flagellar motor switch protein FliN/FliY
MTDGTQDKPVDPMDDWASALAEQTSAEQATSTAGRPALRRWRSHACRHAGSFTVSRRWRRKRRRVPQRYRDDSRYPVQLTVELGRTKVPIKNLLQLAQGSVVELDGLAGEPMDVLVNGYLIAQGEVVVVNDKFGIRLTDIITPSERIRKLNK